MTLKAIALAIAVALALPSLAQSLVDVCNATDPADPDYDITDFDPQRDADDWCKLAYHQPHKARRQLAKAVALVRSQNNANRFYFDPKHGTPAGLYIQILRPWMAEQNATGEADWRVRQIKITTRNHLEYGIAVEDALTGFWLWIEVSPREGFNAYGPNTIRVVHEGRTGRCSYRESAPDWGRWTAAEVKREVEHTLGQDDGLNCREDVLVLR